jgi:HAD superfamily hydrolase (TIGR01509 family)
MVAPIRALLLDLYDTLVHPDWALLLPGRERLAGLAGADVHAMREQWQRTHEGRMRGWHGGLEGDLTTMLGACGITPDADLLAELVRLEYGNWVEGVQPFADVRGELAALRSAGYQLAIVSNASCEAGAVVTAFGLDQAVDTVVLSCEVGALKPEPEILQIALERLGMAAEKAMLVDDVPPNLDAALRLGMQAVLMVRQSEPPLDAGCHPQISQLADLWPLLRG